MGALRMMARAIAIRCRWPPERVSPRSPMTVSYPSSRSDDEVVGVGGFGSGLDISSVRGVQLAVGDVLPDGGAEEDRVLEDDPDLPPQGLELVVLYVHPVDTDGALLGLVEAQDQADERGFAGSRGAHQRHPLAGTGRRTRRPSGRPLSSP